MLLTLQELKAQELKNQPIDLIMNQIQEPLFEHRIKSNSNLNFELDRVLDNLDRAESWVRYNSDLYSDVLAKRQQKKIVKYRKEWEDSVKIRDEDRKLIRDMISYGNLKDYVIEDHTLRNLKSRGFV